MSLEDDIKEVFGIVEHPPRTRQQNKALHLYFTLLADAFNSAGLDMKDVLKVINLGIDWTPTSVKESLWKPIQKKVLGKESTTELTTKEVTQLYEAINLALSTRLGISVEFPTEEQTENYLKSLNHQKNVEK